MAARYPRHVRNARLPRVSSPAGKLRQIQAGLHQSALRFGILSLAVNDTLRAQKLARLSRLIDAAATPLTRLALDLEVASRSRIHD